MKAARPLAVAVSTTRPISTRCEPTATVSTRRQSKAAGASRSTGAPVANLSQKPQTNLLPTSVRTRPAKTSDTCRCPTPSRLKAKAALPTIASATLPWR